MTANHQHTELLFSYGTLQLEAVQIATFGRLLAGTSDALHGNQNADQYEVPAVKRVAVVLRSGARAWAYVDASRLDAENVDGC